MGRGRSAAWARGSDGTGAGRGGWRLAGAGARGGAAWVTAGLSGEKRKKREEGDDGRDPRVSEIGRGRGRSRLGRREATAHLALSREKGEEKGKGSWAYWASSGVG